MTNINNLETELYVQDESVFDNKIKELESILDLKQDTKERIDDIIYILNRVNNDFRKIRRDSKSRYFLKYIVLKQIEEFKVLFSEGNKTKIFNFLENIIQNDPNLFILLFNEFELGFYLNNDHIAEAGKNSVFELFKKLENIEIASEIGKIFGLKEQTIKEIAEKSIKSLFSEVKNPEIGYQTNNYPYETMEYLMNLFDITNEDYNLSI